MGKFSIIAELWEFITTQKKLWLIPIIGCLIIAAALLFFAESSVVAPFIYALF